MNKAKNIIQGRRPKGKALTRKIRGYVAKLPGNNEGIKRPKLPRFIRRAWKGKNKRNLATTLARAARRGILRKIPGVDAMRPEAWAVV
jgi:hypothetical protein